MVLCPRPPTCTHSPLHGLLSVQIFWPSSQTGERDSCYSEDIYSGRCSLINTSCLPLALPGRWSHCGRARRGPWAAGRAPALGPELCPRRSQERVAEAGPSLLSPLGRLAVPWLTLPTRPFPSHSALPLPSDSSPWSRATARASRWLGGPWGPTQEWGGTGYSD